MLPRHVGGRYPTPGHWWLVTELNRVHWLFRPALFRRVHEPKSGGRCETRTRISLLQAVGNPLIRTAHWGEMRESNSRDWSHNPAPKPFGQSRHKTSGAGRVNRTLVGEVQALCTSIVLDQLTKTNKLRSWHAASNCGRALTVRLLFLLSYTSGAGAAIRSPRHAKTARVGDPDSNADHGLTRPALFPLSYTSAKLWTWRGE